MARAAAAVEPAGGPGSTRVRRAPRPETGELTDEALLAGMAQGDDASAVAFVRRYQRRVFGLAYGMVGDAGMAEDIAQEALVRAWRHAPVFDARRGSATTWVLTIARNLAIDALRVRRSVPVGADELVGLLGHDRPTEDALAATEIAGGLRNALAGIPVEQRRALILAAVYGYTAHEVGRLEAIPLGTAKTRIRTALSKVRHALDEQASHHEDVE